MAVVQLFALHLAKLMSLAMSARLGALSVPEPMDVIGDIAPRPVVIMHGRLDDVISYQHAEALFAGAKQPKKLWICEDAVHTALYNTDPGKFEKVVHELIAKISR